jgi:transposase
MISSLWTRRAALLGLLARVGSPAPSFAHAYLFANRRTNRLKVLVNDGLGVWLAARRLHQGKFAWPAESAGSQLPLTRAQLDALVLGLPWHRIGEQGVIGLL